MDAMLDVLGRIGWRLALVETRRVSRAAAGEKNAKAISDERREIEFMGTQAKLSDSGPSAIDSDRYCSLQVEFEQIAKSQYRWFHTFALRMSKNHHDAEDAVQDAYLAALEHLSDLNSSTKLKSWIASIVLNCARMQYRVKNRFPFSLDHPMDDEGKRQFVETLRDPGRSPEESYVSLELQLQLNNVIASLPSALGETFSLRRLKGLSTAETAARLGITEGLVKVRLCRASARVRKALLRRSAAGLRSTRKPDGRILARNSMDVVSKI